MIMEQKITGKLGKNIEKATERELYEVLLSVVKEMAAERSDGTSAAASKKKVYYVSAEFLIGKLLSNNLINLGIYDEVKELLAAHGRELSAIEEIEPEPSLGNGGLGRLAACFLDSMATLGLPAELSSGIVPAEV